MWAEFVCWVERGGGTRATGLSVVKEHSCDTLGAVNFTQVTYYMAGSVRGQDEANTAPWLSTRVVKMELSCPLRIAL